MFKSVLGGLTIPRQTLESLLSDRVPPGSEIQMLLANSVASAYARTIRGSAEGTAAGTHRSDWCPDRRQHGVKEEETDKGIYHILM
jgi:hypothetical protein